MSDQSLFSTLLNRLPATNRWKFWLSLAFFAKLIIFILCLFKPSSENPFIEFWGQYGGDTDAYLLPMENLVKNGTYEPDFRLPGYSLLYLPFYLLFSKAMALNCLIVLQLLLASLSVYLTALIAQFLFKDKVYFVWTFFLFAISTFSNMFDTVLMTESFGVSFLVIAIYTFFKYTETADNRWILGTGLLMTEAVFLRPGFLPILLMLLIVLIAYNLRKKWALGWPIAFLLLPFVIVDSVWVVRNFYQHNKFAPLQTSVAYPGTEEVILSQFKFVQSWGGDIVYWEAGAEIRWFGYGPAMHATFGKGVDTSAELPDYIYTSKFNKDSLRIIKQKLMATYQDSSLTKQQIAANKQYASDKFLEYATSVRQEKPFLYYVKAPLILLKKFLIHSGTYNLFSRASSELNVVEWAIKVFYSLFYLGALVVGFLGILLWMKECICLHRVGAAAGVVVYIATVHPFILRFSEYRYFIPAWPFLMIFVAYALVWGYQRITRLIGRTDT